MAGSVHGYATVRFADGSMLKFGFGISAKDETDDVILHATNVTFNGKQRGERGGLLWCFCD